MCYNEVRQVEREIGALFLVKTHAEDPVRVRFLMIEGSMR